MIGTLGFVFAYGIWRSRNVDSSDNFLAGKRDLPWWTIGLSVMATQASAITFLSTPGQAYESGMGFVQFYFGLPLAMIIISPALRTISAARIFVSIPPVPWEVPAPPQH